MQNAANDQCLPLVKVAAAGPNRPLIARAVTTVQLHQTSHSCFAQHFVGSNVCLQTN